MPSWRRPPSFGRIIRTIASSAAFLLVALCGSMAKSMNEDRTERMTEAQIARMRALEGTPTEEIVMNIARLYKFSIDEALALIEKSQRGEFRRIFM